MEAHGLYDPRNEHDACGVGMVAHIKGAKSHDIVTRALEILANLDHRGAVGADPLLGDGAGILLQMPDPLFRAWADEAGISLPQPGEYAVAQCFLPREPEAAAFVSDQLEKFVVKEGQIVLGWREVPTTLDGLGKAVVEFHAGHASMRGRARTGLRRSGRVRAQADRNPQADAQSAQEAGREA